MAADNPNSGPVSRSASGSIGESVSGGIKGPPGRRADRGRIEADAQDTAARDRRGGFGSARRLAHPLPSTSRDLPGIGVVRCAAGHVSTPMAAASTTTRAQRSRPGVTARQLRERGQIGIASGLRSSRQTC
jgi:hypothetical protein